MKKLLAIFLSALMLCATISFTTVAAAEDTLITVEAYVEETELNAGDEFEVSLNLLNNPGINGAGPVMLNFDEDVFEVVTYYDEDEEDYFNQIEVASKWNASSNKYITLGPVGKCSVMYLRADAKSNQLRTEELFYTVTLRVKEDAVSGTYDLTPYCGESSKVFFTNQFNADGTAIGGKFTVHPFEIQAATVTVNGSEPSCEHEYEYDCSKNCKLCGEETRPEAEHEFFNDCETVCMICYEEVREASHNVIHVEAKAPTCTAEGNLEYWYCDKCGAAWLNAECTKNTNLKAVKLPMADHTYTDDCDATCNACGAEREVILPAAPIAFGGNSISEKKNGLAFLFSADVDGIIIGEDYKADYSNATVIINGEEHKLIKMGAIVNNKGYADQTLDNVDGRYVMNVEANKVFDASNYAIRIINIPAEKLDATITARSYLTYECDGELITIYGEDIATSYNAELG